MNNKSNINIDSALNAKLKAYEASTLDSDWTAMSALLDEDDKGVLPLPLTVTQTQISKQRNLKIIITMSILFTTAAAILTTVWPSSNPSQNSLSNNSIVNIEIKKENHLEQILPKDYEAIKFSDFEKPNTEHTKPLKSIVYSIADTKPDSTEAKIQISAKEVGSKKLQFAKLKTIEPKDSLKGLLAGKIKKQLIREVWVEPEYEEILIGHDKDIKDAWIGMHFTQEYPLLQDSVNSTTGFNLQIMSGNILKTSNFALYSGLDWGMQFRGRSDKQDVVLTTDEAGYTLMSSLSHDFLFKAHLEYSQHRIVPYVTGFVGPRMYFTGQKVAMYTTPSDADGTTRENIEHPTVVVYGAGAGARIKLGPYVSFDARYEWVNGADKNVVDLNESRLVGTNYDLVYRDQKTNFGQLKLGFIFDLSTSEYEKKVIKEGYYKQEVQTYYVDPADANNIFLPCNCDPCDDKDVEDENKNGSSRSGDILDILESIPNSGSSGGGSKPEIKAPVIRN